MLGVAVGLAVSSGGLLAVSSAEGARVTGRAAGPALVAPPIRTEPLIAKAIAAGGDHTCAITIGGGVVCWGANDKGQVGDGTTTDRLLPVPVVGLSNVVAIAAGEEHTCALTGAGGVFCWGGNSDGQLGTGSISDHAASPFAVYGLASGVTAIAGGGLHACALTSAGAVKCWGDNVYGELGDGTATHYESKPVQVSGLSSGVVAITAGLRHTCALGSGTFGDVQGTVRCWGDDTYGQLGDGKTNLAANPKPVQVADLNAVAAVAAGGSHTCALVKTGAALCWGWNGDGELGDGTTTNRSSRAQVFWLSQGVTAIAAGSEDSCALTITAGVKCWGANRGGELGIGTYGGSMSAFPVDVFGLSIGVKAIAVGDYSASHRGHACALLSTGGVRCWGSGALGDGMRRLQSTPVSVLIPVRPPAHP